MTTVYTLFPEPLVALPTLQNSDTSPYSFAVEFSVSNPCQLNAIWFYSGSGATDLPSDIALYTASDSTLVHTETATWSGAAGSGSVRAEFASKPTLSAATNYKAVIHQPVSTVWYSATSHYWDTGDGSAGITNGPITAPNNASVTGDGGQCTFLPSTSPGCPVDSFNAGNYWLDPEVQLIATPISSGLLMSSIV